MLTKSKKIWLIIHWHFENGKVTVWVGENKTDICLD
jgi:hypothetical protein